MSQWISVDKVSALPEVGKAVLLGNPSWPRACVGYLEDAATMDWVGFFDKQYLPTGDPTHWQPIPELP